jgi:hypothetical protein
VPALLHCVHYTSQTVLKYDTAELGLLYAAGTEVPGLLLGGLSSNLNLP